MTASAETVLVAGMVAATPFQAGATWSVFQWVVSLRELGHRVVLVEEMSPEAIRPAGVPLSASDNARYFMDWVRRFDLERRACLLLAGSKQTVGMPYRALAEQARGASCVLNISGTLKDETILGAPQVRVYLDVDPGFTQLWEAQGHDLGAGRHDRHLTVGLALDSGHRAIPTGGHRWVPTLPPVALSHWPPIEVPPTRDFTTVVNWRGYGGLEHQGVFYGQKAHSFRELFALPALTGRRFELATALEPAEGRDLAALKRNGWKLVDPIAAAGSADGYRSFLQGSRAELNVAKSGYVKARCGWFSDRSACYLASGRPVVAQDTGLSAELLPGEGLVAFRDPATAAEAVKEVAGNYRRHAGAARRFAEERLDGRRVAAEALEAVLR